MYAIRSYYDRFDTTETPVLNENGDAYLGIDAGSTTLKAVVINDKEEIVYSEYMPNSGNPVPIVKKFLETVYAKFPSYNFV